MLKLLHLFLAVIAIFVSSVASAQTTNTATLTWSAVTARTDGSPLGGTATYQIYQGLQGATKAKVGSPTTAVTSTITSLLGGRTYCWQVSTVVGAEESALSNEACKTFPQAPPQATTLQVQ